MHHSKAAEQRQNQAIELNWSQFLEVISQIRFEKLLFEMQQVLECSNASPMNKSNIQVVEEGDNNTS